MKKSIIAWLIIATLLAISFSLIFLCSQYSVKMLLTYPVVDCTNLTLLQSDNELLVSATIEWIQNEALAKKGQDVSYAGNVQCFCIEMSAQGDTPDALYTKEELPLCQDYNRSIYRVLLMTNIITGIIVVINTLIREITIALITWIGYDTHSEQLTKITNGVFIGQFFNTAILLLLVYANFEDNSFFNGPFYDYSDKWYAVVGSQIVKTMIINSILPPCVEAVPIIMGWFFRRMDQSWAKDKVERLYSTKTTQIYQYIDLYSGPEYIIHFKYSIILNTTFVTMMYGLGLPILFPVAAFAYFIFWSTERYQMAYTYQMPPALDDTLTKNTLNMLSYSPILFLFNGLWMISNHQIFGRDVNKISDTNDIMLTGHTVSGLFEHL